jgi:hypothetical protein
MRTIDLHAHLTPQCFQREVRAGQAWHGMTSAEGDLHNPMNGWMPEQRLADMDSLGRIWSGSWACRRRSAGVSDHGWLPGAGSLGENL